MKRIRITGKQVGKADMYAMANSGTTSTVVLASAARSLRDPFFAFEMTYSKSSINTSKKREKRTNDSWV